MIGRWLGIALLISFLTGLFSHFEQARLAGHSEPAGFALPGDARFARAVRAGLGPVAAGEVVLLLEATIVLAGVVVLVIQSRRKLSA